MVDVGLFQSLSYVAAAIGVCVAAKYYAMMLREQRRMGMVEDMMRTITDYEGSKRWIELLNYEWVDYADFEKKYGSDNNVDAAAKRYSAWTVFNAMGMMLRKGMMEAEDLYDLGGNTIIFQWAKWKPIVEEIRRRYWRQDYLRDFEYLNEEMMKIKMRRDPSYMVPETLGKFIPDR